MYSVIFILHAGDPLLVTDALLLQEEVDWMLSQQLCNNL